MILKELLIIVLGVIMARWLNNKSLSKVQKNYLQFKCQTFALVESRKVGKEKKQVGKIIIVEAGQGSMSSYNYSV